MIKVDDYVYIKDYQGFRIPKEEKCLVVQCDDSDFRPFRVKVPHDYLYGQFTTFWFEEDELELVNGKTL